MRDTLPQDRAIRDALLQGYPGECPGRLARHVTPLAALISGSVASQSTPLPKLAATVPEASKPASRVQRFTRWVENAHLTTEGSVVPYAETLLAPLAVPTLVRVIAGRVGGRGGVALLLHVVSTGRALPLAWIGRAGKQGHFPAALPIALVQQGHAWIPPGARGVVWGEGACDGPTLQHTLQESQWSYVVHTGSPLTGRWDGERLRCAPVAACLKPGPLGVLPEVHGTEAAYGPVMLRCCWAIGYQEPLHLITHLTSADEACGLYAQRCRLATVLSDQKRRGLHLHTSPMQDPTRLARLLIAAC